MSSHREAPEISKDPAADNTDVYAFVSPDRPSTVTLIANYIPLQQPNGGPNFYEFGEDVLYEIHVSNKGTAKADITYQFRFTTTIRNKNTFLYNTGPIKNIGDKTWNRPQHYSVTRVEHGKSQVIARGLTVPPCNVGKRSTPNYRHLSGQAVHPVKGGRKVFAGQRADAFHVDLGSIFDLGGLRPLNQAHLIKLPVMHGMNGLEGVDVHTIAIQVPIKEVTRKGDAPKDVMSPDAVIGVWASASRQTSRVFNKKQHKYVGHGAWQQVSRLGNPLFNEVIVPMAHKDQWNSQMPSQDRAFAKYVAKPELAGLLPVLYPGAFPHLAKYKKPRVDLEAILLSGIPAGVVKGFQNATGGPPADMLRLNVAIKPTKKPNALGLVAGDAAGFPNGRRPGDDVVTIELRAVAGLTIPLVDKTFKPDAAVGLVSDGTSNNNGHTSNNFPFLGLPGGGYETKNGHASAS